jgi:aspartyl protease family protein
MIGISISVLLFFIISRTEQGALLIGEFISSSEQTRVTLHADEMGHFFGQLKINGVSLKYIVDSGASNVTMNSYDAKRANIDYTKGDVVGLLTPAGEVKAFSLNLNGVMIGEAIINDVKATIVEGSSPPYVLLGISAQRKLDVKRDNAVMTLGEKL